MPLDSSLCVRTEMLPVCAQQTGFSASDVQEANASCEMKTMREFHLNAKNVFIHVLYGHFSFERWQQRGSQWIRGERGSPTGP